MSAQPKITSTTEIDGPRTDTRVRFDFGTEYEPDYIMFRCVYAPYLSPRMQHDVSVERFRSTETVTEQVIYETVIIKKTRATCTQGMSSLMIKLTPDMFAALCTDFPVLS